MKHFFALALCFFFALGASAADVKIDVKVKLVDCFEGVKK